MLSECRRKYISWIAANHVRYGQNRKLNKTTIKKHLHQTLSNHYHDFTHNMVEKIIFCLFWVDAVKQS